ncbi:MAG: GAF domain-containing protein [Anaerolineales bacterium]
MAEAVYSENSPQRQRLQALYHLAVELSALHDLQSVLDTALLHCLSLTDSQFGFIGLNTLDGSAMDVAAIQGFHPASEFYEHFHLIPLRPSIFARVVLENRPVRSDDATNDPMRVGQPHGHPPVRAFLGVPLLVQDKTVGMIGVANRPVPYDDDHEQLLVTYAAQVAIVIRNVQLYEELTTAKADLERKVVDRTKELQDAKEALAQTAAQLRQQLAETVGVQERERQRIAQDIHDGINQLLIGAMLELKSAHERIGIGEVKRADNSLQRVREILHRVEAELRRIIYDLRPPTLDALGLAPSLRRYAARFEQYSGISCEVTAEGEAVRLAPHLEIGIYRIMQEALQNVSAHAQARSVHVRIGFNNAEVRLAVIDDGQGFDLAAAQANSNGRLGIMNMHERAESLSGQLTISSEIGRGTQVNLLVPV